MLPHEHIAACPKCRSKDISAEPIGIEFTKMTCNTCGDWDVVDVWGRADWYSAASKVCTICRAIPRNGSWPVESTLAKFGLVQETFGSETKYVPCPECGETYWYSYHEWLEDWQSESSFAFTRLDIAQTCESLPQQDRAAYAEQIPKVVEELELDLFSQHRFDRMEAAWKLARYYNSHQLWDKLKRLLANPHEEIFAEAFLQIFPKPGENDDPEPPPAYMPQEGPVSMTGPALVRGLQSNDQRIKEIATTGLCQAAIDSGATDDLLRILQSKDLHVAEHALWYLAYKAQVLKVTPLRELLIQCVKAGSVFQATCALKILRRGREDGSDPVPPFAFIVGCLKHKKTEIRKEAVDQLFSWAVSKGEREQALKILAHLLKDKLLNYHAMEQLKNLAEFGGKEIAAIIPEIISHVKKKRYRWEDAMQILRYASEHRINISAIYPFIAKSIAVGDRTVIESSSIIVDHILQKRTNVSSLRKDLERGLETMYADYYGEQLIKLLVRIYLRARDYPALTKLVHHANNSVVLFATSALREALDSSPENSEAVKILASIRRADAH